MKNIKSKLVKLIKNGTGLYEFWHFLSQIRYSFVISTVRVALCINIWEHACRCLNSSRWLMNKRGSSPCGITCESLMILTIVSQHFILYFPLSRALKLYGCPLESKSLAFLSNIFTLRVSLLCGDTETQPCLVIYFVTFYFYSTKQHEH